MSRTRIALSAGTALVLALAASPRVAASAAPGAATPTSTSSPVAGSPDPAGAVPGVIEEFPRQAFHDPTRIDNPYLPLTPGTRVVLVGRTGIGPDRQAHQIVQTVTDLTKVVDGIPTTVVYEQDITGGALVEAEIIFYAQDDNGTVWLMGEYPEEYGRRGRILDSPGWITGKRGAAAGIVMPATPRSDTPSYSEGWGPEVGWTDRGRILETGSTTCVARGCLQDVLVIDEFNRDTPDSHQLKYYAPGIGPVRVGWAGALDDSHESLRLGHVVSLGPTGLANARQAAFALEARAYQRVPDIYAGSPAMEPR
jgi:hypothetical protein